LLKFLNTQTWPGHLVCYATIKIIQCNTIQTTKCSPMLSLVHTLHKSAPEIRYQILASLFRADCIWHKKKLAPIYSVEINNGRRQRCSSFHPNV